MQSNYQAEFISIKLRAGSFVETKEDVVAEIIFIVRTN